jgi:ABC-type transport system involved in multi-copper enzyme maturation permease subunit
MIMVSITHNPTLPSNPSQIGILAKYEMLNYVRSKRLALIFLTVAVPATFITISVGYYHIRGFLASPLSFYSSWTGYSDIFVIVVLSSFFGDAISSEFQNKTGYSILGTPLTRSTFYVGKYLACLILCLSAFTVYQLVAIGNVAYYFGFTLPAVFGESFGLESLLLASVLGIAFFLSSVLKNGALAVLATAGVLLFVFEILGRFAIRFSHTEPWYLLNYGATVIQRIFENPYPVHSLSTPTILEGMTIMAGYLVASFCIGLVIFKRSEMR